MTEYEIHIHNANPELQVQRVSASGWFAALQEGLLRAGQAPLSPHAACFVQPDASITVEDGDSHRAFIVKRVEFTHGPVAEVDSDLPDPFNWEALPSGAVLKARETLGYESLSAAATPVSNPWVDAAEHIANAMSTGESVDRRLDDVLARLSASLPALASAVLLIDPDNRSFYFASAIGHWQGSALRRRLPLESGLLARCLRSRRPLNVRDPLSAPGQLGELEQLIAGRPNAALIAPIMDTHRLYGVLLMLDAARFEGTRLFEEEDTKLSRLVGRALGAHLAKLLPSGSATA